MESLHHTDSPRRLRQVYVCFAWRSCQVTPPTTLAVSVQEEVEQEEGATGGVVLPRTAFLHTADQLHCPLFLPWPGDQVGYV